MVSFLPSPSPLLTSAGMRVKSITIAGTLNVGPAQPKPSVMSKKLQQGRGGERRGEVTEKKGRGRRR